MKKFSQTCLPAGFVKHFLDLNSPGLQPGDYKTPKYHTAASTAMLVVMPCLQRVIWGIAMEYRRLKPAGRQFSQII
ncbi:MAG: hypothetical protein JXA72_01380 [Bacteroidales bacterium]|nr:hypothetical protein [Bacteroidales bacterium]